MDPRADYFGAIADQWDGWQELEALRANLAAGLREFGVAPDEKVLDVGCGTGNLTSALLAHLSSSGRVIAVDIAPRMIELAHRKIADTRVEWHVSNAQRLLVPAESCDRVICYSVWPHFDDRLAVATEFWRVLRSGGKLHVWHLLPRDRVNTIHAAAGEAVRADVLPPADETAHLLGRLGFSILAAEDGSDRYLVTAVKLGDCHEEAQSLA